MIGNRIGVPYFSHKPLFGGTGLNVQAENGDYLITEGGDWIIQEGNIRYYRGDGAGDYVDCVTASAPFNIDSTQDLSIVFWVRLTSSNLQNFLFWNFGNTSANKDNRIMLTYSSPLNRLTARVRSLGVNFDNQWDLTDNSAATGITDNVTKWTASQRGNTNADGWTMITVTYDASEAAGADALKMYWNTAAMSVSAASTSGTRTAMAATHGRIGENLGETDSQGNVLADMDEIKIYNKVLTPAEISTIYNSGVILNAASTVEDGLITEWSFDDGTGDDREDVYTCTLVNAITAPY